MYSYLIKFKFLSPNNETRLMVVKQCKDKVEAEEAFRCRYKNPANTHIENIELWDGKITGELEFEANICTLQELREYRDAW